ncbi:MAG: TonB-dependent receptor plug domain-containing protein [Bacteroidota bacterium]
MNHSQLGILLITAFISLCFVSCTSSSQSMSAKRAPAEVNSMGYLKTNQQNPSNLELADHLRKVSGLVVSGKGQNVNIRVRGVNSINGSTEPLFVLDGTPLGDNYGSVADAINPNDIKSIRVLKGADATLYGTRGANGVILIRMNKN